MDTQKRNKRQEAWKAEHYDRIHLMVPKGQKEKLQAAAAAEGLSLSQYIIKKMDLR